MRFWVWMRSIYVWIWLMFDLLILFFELKWAVTVDQVALCFLERHLLLFLLHKVALSEHIIVFRINVERLLLYRLLLLLFLPEKCCMEKLGWPTLILSSWWKWIFLSSRFAHQCSNSCWKYILLFGLLGGCCLMQTGRPLFVLYL